MIFKGAARNKDEETISDMLLNDTMDLTMKNLIYGLMKPPYLKILKRIIASGREIGLDFQNITDFKGNEKELKKKKEVIDFLQEFRNDPEKSLMSLRNELGLSGMNFFIFFLSKIRLKMN